MNIKICINTNVAFSKQTLPIITTSLCDVANISPKDIVIIEGGHDKRSVDTYNNIVRIKVAQNSIEYTSLIEIVESELESKYWFLLHDTCRVGPKFKQLINNFRGTPDTIALKHWPSMSIGLYKFTYLMEHKQRLLDIKNTNYDTNVIQQWKQWGIYNEDYMLWRLGKCEVYNSELEHPDKFLVVDEPDWYTSAVKRRVEYYPQLDLYKNKANWEPKPWMEIQV